MKWIIINDKVYKHSDIDLSNSSISNLNVASAIQNIYFNDNFDRKKQIDDESELLSTATSDFIECYNRCKKNVLKLMQDTWIDNKLMYSIPNESSIKLLMKQYKIDQSDINNTMYRFSYKVSGEGTKYSSWYSSNSDAVNALVLLVKSINQLEPSVNI